MRNMTLRATNIVEITGKVTIIASTLGWMVSTIAATALDNIDFRDKLSSKDENKQGISSGMAEAQNNDLDERGREVIDL
jgi:hypothetical protein